MSDHWNSLADQLGTPSLVPHQRKPAGTPVKAKEQVNPVQSAPVGDLEPTISSAEEAPVKAESPSRIRSSWDTVARLFGVGAAPEPAVETPASMFSEKSLPAQTEGTDSAVEDLFSGFGKKKERKSASMWGSPTPEEPPVVSSTRIEEPIRPSAGASNRGTAPAPSAKKRPSFWDTVEDAVEPVAAPTENEAKVESDRPARSRSDSTRSQPARNDRRPPATNETRGDSRPGSRSASRVEPTKPVDFDSEEPSAEDQIESAGGQPERRGRRRNIRRGRNPDAETVLGRDEESSDSSVDPELLDDEDSFEPAVARTPERSPRPPRENRPRERRPNDDRPRESRSDTRSDSRSDSRGETRVDSRGDSRTNEARPARTPRPEGAESKSRDRDASRPDSRADRPQPSREGNRERGERSDVRNSEQRDRPPRTERVDRSESVSPRPAAKRGWDDLEIVDEPFLEVGDEDIEVLDNGDSEPASDEPKRRRRRRRGGAGRRPATEDVANDDDSSDNGSGRQVYGRHADDDESDNDDSSLDRGFKVTAWADAIASIIDRNMENHKRPSSNDHRNRGGNRNNGNSRRRS